MFRQLMLFSCLGLFFHWLKSFSVFFLSPRLLLSKYNMYLTQRSHKSHISKYTELFNVDFVLILYITVKIKTLTVIFECVIAQKSMRIGLSNQKSYLTPWARGYKTFSMLKSAKHEILNAHKYENIKKFGIFQAQISLECWHETVIIFTI